MKIVASICIYILVCTNVFAQEDEYGGYFDPDPNSNILIVPGYLGPNALPIRPIRNGLIGSEFKFQANQSSHFMRGDNTFNLDGYLLAPVVRNFMALETQWYLLEYYRSSNEVRDWRRLEARDEGGKLVIGDLNISMLLQLIREHKWLPDLIGIVGHKTTLGPVEDGHYTNTPALWASLSMGKDLLVKPDFRFRLNAYIGFFVYHTNRAKITQNEGPVMGLETQFNYKSIEFATSVSGYTGWEEVGHDDPFYFIARIKKLRKRVDWHLEYRTGISDYPYETIKVGFTWHLPSFLDFKRLNWKEVLKNE